MISSIKRLRISAEVFSRSFLSTYCVCVISSNVELSHTWLLNGEAFKTQIHKLVHATFIHFVYLNVCSLEFSLNQNYLGEDLVHVLDTQIHKSCTPFRVKFAIFKCYTKRELYFPEQTLLHF